MNLIKTKTTKAKDLNDFIEFWSLQYYNYTNVSDSIYYYCINSINNNVNINKAICLIGAWKTNSISLYSKTGNLAYTCNCGKKYYYTNMWKSGTSSAYDVWINLHKKNTNHKALLNKPLRLVQKIINKPYNGSKSPNTKFGLVYTLTYLHFLQPDYFPIYDRFVFLAINYINNKQLPQIPYKNTQTINSYSEYENKYVSQFVMIKKMTGLESRVIDKALWSFGHYISNSKKLVKPVCCTL